MDPQPSTPTIDAQHSLGDTTVLPIVWSDQVPEEVRGGHSALNR